MAYDEELTKQFRKALDQHKGVTEKKMMGGICFMLNGNMVGGADRTKDGQGRFMFRVGKQNDQVASQLPGSQEMLMGGRRMSGMYFVDESECDPETMLKWMELALAFVKTLPKK